MLDRFKNYVDSLLSPDSIDDTASRLQLATTALLIEMMRQDDVEHHDERQLIKQLIKRGFSCTDDETDELYRQATKKLDASVDYYQFTSLIARHFTPHQKFGLIENLWRVALADHELDAFEEHMVRRIADLIHVPHRDFIRAKHMVQKSLAKR